MVENDDEALFHIEGNQVLIPQNIEGQTAHHAADGEPAEGNARHKAHGGEDEEHHQRTAHIGGDKVVHQKQRRKVAHQEGHMRDFLQGIILLQPRKLIGQHHDEQHLDNLGRLDIDGQELKIQPCAVACIIADTQGGQQQGNEAEVGDSEPNPQTHLLFHQLVQIHLLYQEEHYHADKGGDTLHHGKAVGLHVAGGGINHHNTKARGDDAQGQQNTVGMAQHVLQIFSCTTHSATSFSVKYATCSLPQEVFCVNGW